MVGMKKPGNWNSLNEIIAEMPEDNGTGFLVIGRLFAKRSEQQMVTSSSSRADLLPTAKRLSINVIDAAVSKVVSQAYYSAQPAASLRIDRYRHGQE